ncbi:MAG TPA: endonuclease MutS2 [bacterium]|nr:endonuclease MutS2 [bacterium]
MNPHALSVLEYDQLLMYLSRYTDSELVREKILNIQPSTDVRELTASLKELTEFRDLRNSGEDIPPIRGPEIDLTRSITSSKTIGWRLSPESIAAIGKLMTMTETIQTGFMKLTGIPLLKERISRLVILKELHRTILKTVNEKGQIDDRASSELMKIRQGIRRQQERIRSRLEEMAIKLYEKGALQEPIVTLRNNRYVLPVKAGSVRDVPGNVHDRSSSGATFFIEPKGSVSDHNALTRLEAEELQEINRILREITESIGARADQLLENLSIVIDLDMLQARARFCDELNAIPIFPQQEPMVDLKGAVNPLLLLHRLFSSNPEERRREVVPLDLKIDDEARILVITGPNTGGKTVALRTVGLIVLMIQSGLHPPAEEFSRIGIFDDVYADIGDEQSLEQSLSTFSSHVRQIIDILGHADHRSLVLLDELGAGTDPAEGSALGIAILKELNRRNAWTIANTHHNSIKAFAFTTDGISNAAMEFNADTLEPTYRILMGRIGQSNALSIAERLGFPKHLLTEARQHIEGKVQDLQQMIDRVEVSRIQAERQIARASNERFRARELRQAREDVLNRAEKEARGIIDRAVRESETLLAELHRERDSLKAEIRRLNAQQVIEPDTIEAMKQALHHHRDQAAELTDRLESTREVGYHGSGGPLLPGTPEPGDTVWIKRFRLEAEVLEREGDDRLWVRMQGKRIRIPADGVRLVRKISEPAGDTSGTPVLKPVQVHVESADVEPPPLRLNLVGKRVDEAIDELDRYMDHVIRSGLPQVTIIHGFGTGKLQDAVVRYLKRTRQVISARSGDSSEGGGGVTVVRMASSES